MASDRKKPTTRKYSGGFDVPSAFVGVFPAGSIVGVRDGKVITKDNEKKSKK